MFCYPNLGEDDKWGTKESDNKKINAIVSYYGDFFGEKKWSIGFMGHDNMGIYGDVNEEIECYFRYWIYNNGQFLYQLKNDEDYLTYYKNKKVYLRMEKIDKILKR